MKFWEDLKSSFAGRFVRILWISGRRYKADEHGQRAVALTYYTLFAIVPVAALLFGIAKGFDLDERLRVILTERLSQHQELLEYVYQFADTTLKQAKGGIVAGVGVIALFWTVMWLATSIEKAFNAVWGLPPRRNILRRFSDYLSCMLLIPVMLVVISSAGMLIRGAISRVAERCASGGLSGVGEGLLALSGLTPLLLAVLIFFLIYRMSPNTRVRVMPALLAGAVAGICYQVLQDSFVFLQGSIYRYNRVYGSFAALPLFLMWVRWSWEIALFGAEVGFVAQNLDTGMFDGDRSALPPSLRSRRFRQLAVAQQVYVRFASGAGASSVDALSAALDMPTVHLDRELHELLAAGIICRTDDADGGAAYAPLLPESLTIAECVNRLDEAGDNDLSPRLRQETGALFAATERLRDAVLTSSDNLRLADSSAPDAER
ncbi:MAG: YihY/virulence factor BrkB family protein [Lentisphaeria bacterium]|nr:YihY/virulence factor BrkB family protein [Lentisphaeria bacterium]